jgi:hypothetical protein
MTITDWGTERRNDGERAVDVLNHRKQGLLGEVRNQLQIVRHATDDISLWIQRFKLTGL